MAQAASDSGRSGRSPAWIDDYRAIAERAALVDLSDRTLVELAGDDRASFLHNLCTQDVRRLAEHMGAEAFITSVQGKILGHIYVFAEPEALVVETVPGQTAALLAHFDRYLIREKVTLTDRGRARAEVMVAGPGSPAVLTKLTGAPLPEANLASSDAKIGAAAVRIRSSDLLHPVGFLLECSRGDLEALSAALEGAGATPVSGAAVEAARIEQGTPFYGQDITEKNLPQEVGRDERAISFVKGCYLGQETVARIDALGHVNKRLVSVQFDSARSGEAQPPAHDEPLLAEGQEVGRVTSATFSPRLGSALALAYVRRGHEQPGTRLDSRMGGAQVIALPVPKPQAARNTGAQ